MKKWAIGAIGAFAILALAGVGFSAFTATAQVNGYAYAATMDLEIVNTYEGGCGSLFHATPAGPGNFTFYGENAAMTSISVRATNLTPGVYCEGAIELENTGSVPVNVSVVLETAGTNGICTAYTINCYDVESLSGIEAAGFQWYIGSPNAGHSAYASTNFTTLAPGATYWDWIASNIPPTSTYASTPPSGTFTILYTASAGA